MDVKRRLGLVTGVLLVVASVYALATGAGQVSGESDKFVRVSRGSTVTLCLEPPDQSDTPGAGARRRPVLAVRSFDAPTNEGPTQLKVTAEGSDLSQIIGLAFGGSFRATIDKDVRRYFLRSDASDPAGARCFSIAFDSDDKTASGSAEVALEWSAPLAQ